MNDMKYRMNGRIRYSEVGEDRRLKLGHLVDYYQDCATAHSEDIGGGIDFLTERRRGWVLTSWHILVHEYPLLGERITVETWACSMKSFLANRNFRLVGENGKVFSEAFSEWALIDIDTLRAARISDEIRALFPVSEALSIPPASRHIALPEKMEELCSIPVSPDMLDTNHHVNNSRYVHLAEMLLPEYARPHEFFVEYREAAKMGDTLAIASAGDEAAYVSVKNQEGHLLANLKMAGMQETE